MNDWIKPTVIIAIYGALLSTFTFIWNIIANQKKIKSSLKVSYYFQVTGREDNNSNIGILLIQIINNGQIDVNIHSTSIDLCGKIIKLQNGPNAIIDASCFGLLTQPQFIINRGEMKESSIKIQDLLDFIGNKLDGKDKLRIIVVDTLGHQYYSKKFSYKSLKDFSNVKIDGIH